MNTWAILPLRSLRDGKQRLRDVLSAGDRSILVRRLLEHTLSAIVEARGVSGVCIVTPDPEMLAWVCQFDVLALLQPNHGLNAGLEYARRELLVRADLDALLVILPDLPHLRSADLDEMLRRSTPRSVVLAPDRHGQGTNVLLVRPADALPFAFGEASLQQHEAAAQAYGLHVHHYDAPGTAFDVDTPDDLQVIDQRNRDDPGGVHASAWLCTPTSSR